MKRSETRQSKEIANGKSEAIAAGLTIRRAADRDRGALERLAERDSSSTPRGEVLLAQAGEQVVAAVSLRDGAAVADPFVHSAGALSLLRVRAGQLRRRGHRPGRAHGRGSLAGSPPGAGGRLLVLPPR